MASMIWWRASSIASLGSLLLCHDYLSTVVSNTIRYWAKHITSSGFRYCEKDRLTHCVQLNVFVRFSLLGLNKTCRNLFCIFSENSRFTIKRQIRFQKQIESLHFDKRSWKNKSIFIIYIYIYICIYSFVLCTLSPETHIKRVNAVVFIFVLLSKWFLVRYV